MKPHQFFKPIDLNGNYLSNAKVLIANPANLVDESVVNKGWSLALLNYTSDKLSDSNATVHSIFGVEKSTLATKTVNEILDELLFVAIAHDYILPTLSVQTTIIDTLTSAVIQDVDRIEIGRSVKIGNDATIEFNDSAGPIDAAPFTSTITGGGFTTTTSPATSDFETSAFIIRKSMSSIFTVDYKASTPATDNQGNDDEVGSTANPIFAAAQLSLQYDFTSVWPKFVSVFTGTVATPAAAQLMSTMASATVHKVKLIEQNETVIQTDALLTNTFKTIIIAIPQIANKAWQLDVKQGDETISGLFEIAEVDNVPDAFGSGLVQNYTAFVVTLPIAIETDTKLTINLR